MSRLQTLRMIACMLLMGVVAIAAYLFYQHSLYFCLFFSLMIMAGIIIYICQWQYKTTRMISRMIEVSIRPRACFFPLFSFLPLWLHYNLNPLCVQY